MAPVVLTAVWALVAVLLGRVGEARLARAGGLVAAALAAAAVWPACLPLVPAAWLTCGLSLPDGVLRSRRRRLAAAAAGLAALGWTALLAAADAAPEQGAAVAAGAGVLAVTLVAAVRRHRGASAADRRTLQWVAAAAVACTAAAIVLIALHLVLDLPGEPIPWILGALTLPPAGLLLGRLPATAGPAERVLAEAVVAAGLTLLVVAVYLVLIAGIARLPVGADRDVLIAGILASLVAVALALPLRVRLVSLGRSLSARRGQTPEETLAGFGARMSRAVPFDELMLQLTESLKATLGPAGAEVWVGTEGMLRRTVSVPELPAARLTLTDKERLVVGRTPIGGAAWAEVWLPHLLAGHPRQAPVRVVPAAHLGDLLGLLVVRRTPEAPEFTEAENRVLIELARQVGLALHTLRLDSALQASLEELRRSNAELRASRLRIVTAADASRRAIERDLHDGAQQHLVTLSVKLGLACAIVQSDPAAAAELLQELRGVVRATNAAFRELAHGIYPPLLRAHGLGEALRSATRRLPLRHRVTADLPYRYPEQVEAAVYFCCLEAVQNAAKHAGPGAFVQVRIHAEEEELRFEVRDDGRGFTPGAGQGHGFVNMRDRLGAVGGVLTVESAPGEGTAVSGRIPARPAG
ncbi:sensor histidine kinase [Rhizohabitans arisaemae]|uniref:sensor histidine kinase n=1 Tax=Rhizohabitans arisaemae TaxID=2720610 RepID=UPI0024B1D936|nr:ATP-binding protein [Rhizohabitans arisaemae]